MTDDTGTDEVSPNQETARRLSCDLSAYDNSWYQPGGLLRRTLWYYVNLVLFSSRWIPVSSIKVIALRLFGATIGRGVTIKPMVNIKYPWKLVVGDHVWIGEEVWIDNLDRVEIQSHCCLSQGAMLLCGNHNYQTTSFDLMVDQIHLGTGVWVGARAVICAGVTCGSHSVATVGSIVTRNTDAFGIYRGNPATKCKERRISESPG